MTTTLQMCMISFKELFQETKTAFHGTLFKGKSHTNTQPTVLLLSYISPYIYICHPMGTLHTFLEHQERLLSCVEYIFQVEDFHYECSVKGQTLPATVNPSDGTVSCYIAEEVSWSLLGL